MSRIPPMPEGFTDQTAWDAIHWKFGQGSILDQIVIDWQLDNQDRVKTAMEVKSRLKICPFDGTNCYSPLCSDYCAAMET